MAHWEIWSVDYFDRDAPPHCECSGDDFLGGCAGLWRMTIDEGVQADGQATFTWFSLRWPDGGISLPRDPFANPALARLQSWVTTPGVISALAKSLASKPVESEANRILDIVLQAGDAWDFCQRLGYPAEKPPARWRFDFNDENAFLQFVASREIANAKALVLRGPTITAASVRALSASHAKGPIHFLWISAASLGDQGLVELTRANLPDLRTLGLCCCGIGDPGVAHLTHGPTGFRLVELSFANTSQQPCTSPNTIGPQGARHLAQSRILAQLENLDISGNPVGDAGIEALMTTSTLANVREITAWNTGMTASGARQCQRLGIGSRVLHSDHDRRLIDYSQG